MIEAGKLRTFFSQQWQIPFFRYMILRVSISALLGLLYVAALLIFTNPIQRLSGGNNISPLIFFLALLGNVFYFVVLDPWLTGATAGWIAFSDWKDGIMTWPRALYIFDNMAVEVGHQRAS